MRSVPFPDSSIQVHGLPWFTENDPDLFRFAAAVLSSLPERVAAQARFPAGARLRFQSDTRSLYLTAEALTPAKGHGIDVYLDGVYARSIEVEQRNRESLEVFDSLDAESRAIEMYLPYRQEVRIHAISVDDVARMDLPAPYREAMPIVYYGSSVAQGVGAGRASMSYQAIICRSLGFDFVNLGFGGAGKAEPEVVELVSSLKASCLVFDLGKSYGMQDPAPYIDMIDAVRQAQPETPVVCMTPIFSTRELLSPEYAELSAHTRQVVSEASSDKDVIVVDGLGLLGYEDADGLSKDGVHPNELGYSMIANRLAPTLQTALGR